MSTENDIVLMEKFGSWVTEAIKNIPEGYKLNISGTPYNGGHISPCYLDIKIIPNEQEF
jgi:hypothetical protein